MIKKYKSYGLVSAWTILTLLCFWSNAVADTIVLNGLIDSGWDENNFHITTGAPGVYTDRYHTFQSGTIFSLETDTYFSDTDTYGGTFRIGLADQDWDYLSATFNGLQFFSMGFIIGSIFDAEGSIVAASTDTLDGIVLYLNSGLNGQIRGNGLIPNPEPTTFLLLGMGLISLAGLGRRKANAA